MESFNQFRRSFSSEQGQDTVEYALVLGLIAIACVAGMSATGNSLANLWAGVSGSIASWITIMLGYFP